MIMFKQSNSWLRLLIPTNPQKKKNVLLQILGSKCLLCPYITYDLSVIVSVIVFVIYGFFEEIEMLDKNGDLFLLLKVIPSSLIHLYYHKLKWNWIPNTHTEYFLNLNMSGESKNAKIRQTQKQLNGMTASTGWKISVANILWGNYNLKCEVWTSTIHCVN